MDKENLEIFNINIDDLIDRLSDCADIMELLKGHICENNHTDTAYINKRTEKVSMKIRNAVGILIGIKDKITAYSGQNEHQE